MINFLSFGRGGPTKGGAPNTAFAPGDSKRRSIPGLYASGQITCYFLNQLLPYTFRCRDLYVAQN